jgi:peptidyl-prolyl cis-trans isomerase SurA
VIKIKKILFILLLVVASLNSSSATITDGLFITIGDRAVTKSDIVKEIKLILILNNMTYSDEKREELQNMAVKSIIKKTVKNIEISKNEFLQYSTKDVEKELELIAKKVKMDVPTLKNICISNGIDFTIITEQIKTELLWNSLIYFVYKNRVSVNTGEIEEKLKLNKNKKDIYEYLISEIVLEKSPSDEMEIKIKDLKEKIELDGFESAAISFSISNTAINGGDLGWISENEISKTYRSEIMNTPVNSLSKPLNLKEGVLIFKIRDKRKQEVLLTEKELERRLILAEKGKILNMYSLSHYDKLRRTISIKFYTNED